MLFYGENKNGENRHQPSSPHVVKYHNKNNSKFKDVRSWTHSTDYNEYNTGIADGYQPNIRQVDNYDRSVYTENNLKAHDNYIPNQSYTPRELNPSSFQKRFEDFEKPTYHDDEILLCDDWNLIQPAHNKDPNFSCSQSVLSFSNQVSELLRYKTSLSTEESIYTGCFVNKPSRRQISNVEFQNFPPLLSVPPVQSVRSHTIPNSIPETYKQNVPTFNLQNEILENRDAPEWKVPAAPDDGIKGNIPWYPAKSTSKTRYIPSSRNQHKEDSYQSYGRSGQSCLENLKSSSFFQKSPTFQFATVQDEHDRKKKTVVEQIAERVMKRLVRLVCEEVDESKSKQDVGISTEDDRDMEFARCCALLAKYAPYLQDFSLSMLTSQNNIQRRPSVVVQRGAKKL